MPLIDSLVSHRPFWKLFTCKCDVKSLFRMNSLNFALMKVKLTVELSGNDSFLPVCKDSQLQPGEHFSRNVQIHVVKLLLLLIILKFLIHFGLLRTAFLQ